MSASRHIRTLGQDSLESIFSAIFQYAELSTQASNNKYTTSTYTFKIK